MYCMTRSITQAIATPWPSAKGEDHLASLFSRRTGRYVAGAKRPQRVNRFVCEPVGHPARTLERCRSPRHVRASRPWLDLDKPRGWSVAESLDKLRHPAMT